jgi:hypothetical protein
MTAITNTKALLTKAMLHNGDMEIKLYEFELKEMAIELFESLIKDKDELVFALTIHSGDVAMILIEPFGTVYVNEEARNHLQSRWGKAYKSNIKKLLPDWIRQLKKGVIPYHGVKTV